MKKILLFVVVVLIIIAGLGVFQKAKKQIRKKLLKQKTANLPIMEL